ncbi:hypothetical protein TVAG_032460 [Trichomonas vaginalis G3]|uniref:NOT2/NOT3/NOT5 C-terminal domain-containing protein n=1 Tax=Trichomonas vaginalis (strain ATCC PRA-98 / G3) TaxID=412133 RepID=A2FIS6_TRIV3|nr:NOT2 / NOT3 / NOT5 family [Trichomonas vaginalis G3]EAX95179.1 hypothetical protein TVAG_032460 [Trichomonas vaginalis G3]KAI5516173.1 NOT2 / NOT3 / NOT5 family [Trichomonas vaginalis G3]|eukprot:XP_001308109.1 hypothetical protein [Trichomonas vaginalis G3]
MIIRSGSAPSSRVTDKLDDVNRGPTIKDFINEIRSLPPEQKMAQIGIERQVLGIPENSTFDGRSFFSDNAFAILDPSKTPKDWLDFINVSPIASVIPKMPDETLFFMFYAQPHDIVQEIAAQELIKRGWKYSSKTMMWSIQKREGFFSFDIKNWSIKEIPTSQSNP